MDYTKIPLLVKFTKQIHNALEDSSHPDIFNTIGDIKNEIHNDEFLSLYLSKLNGSEELYLIFSIYLYNKNGDAAKSVKYVLENLKGYFFSEFENDGYKLEDCGNCYGHGREDCDYCDGSGTEDCRECDGEGVVTCDDCGGSGEDEDGQRCETCNGDSHVTCEDCQGRGSYTCDSCGGDGHFECNDCNGSGEVETDELLVNEVNSSVYTLNNLDLIFDEGELINEKVYKTRVLIQPYFRIAKWSGDYTVDEIEYEFDLENLDFSNGYLVLYNGRLPL